MFKNNKKKSKPLELDINEAINIKDRLQSMSAGKTISAEDEKAFHIAAQLIGTLISVYGMWTNSKKKVGKLLKMIFGSRSEKSKDLDNNSNNNQSDSSSTSTQIDNENNNTNSSKDGVEDKSGESRIGGGGKNSADDYEGAAEIFCKLADHLLPGSLCPECGKSKLYEVDPKKVVRLIGNAPITAFLFILQQVRCICGAFFTADVGDEFRDIYNEEKYGPSALAAMMIYKYLMGVSFGTLSGIQEMNGIPLPSSTQANKIKDKALPAVQAIVGELKKLASNAQALGFDDTMIRTLEKRPTKDGGKSHKGHGTVIIASDFDKEGRELVLFDFGVSKHAGDVVCDLLSDRIRESLPLLISDGLSSYDECKKSGIDVNCNVHARRKVVEEDPNCSTYIGKTVLECFREIYKNEKSCKEQNFSQENRMEYHKEFSTFYFEKIKAIFNIVSEVEDNHNIRDRYDLPDYLAADKPNGNMRKVSNYFLKRYTPLTRVLEIPNVPLDTNYVERMIKVIIRLRKNSLFFHNMSSASYSGDILSLLETAVQNEVNVFDYMTYILSNKKDVIKNPKYYLPWHYKKSKGEIKDYWKEIAELMKCPSNFLESSNSEYFHSSG